MFGLSTNWVVLNDEFVQRIATQKGIIAQEKVTLLLQGMRERLQPLNSLFLRPEDLPHYATQQFRFSFVRQLRAPENAKGFDRPIYLFQKMG